MKTEYGKGYNQERYRERKIKHLCTVCGKQLDRKGALCIDCKVKMQKRVNFTREKCIKMGICAECRTARATVGYTTCPACREKANIRAKKSYYRRKGCDAIG